MYKISEVSNIGTFDQKTVGLTLYVAWSTDHSIIWLTANKAGVLENLFLSLIFTSEISEGVDDDTKDQIEDDNDDDEEERKVVYYTSEEETVLQIHGISTHAKILQDLKRIQDFSWVKKGH